MIEPAEIKRKPNISAILIAIGATVLLIAVILIVAHAVIEARIFRMLTSQPDVTVKIGSHYGNLFKGYTLVDLSVHRNPTLDRPGSGFTTPKLTVHWRLRPMMVTQVFWDDGKFQLEPQSGPSEEFPISGSALNLSTDPNQLGWLVTEKPIVVGPTSWSGQADLKLRADGQQVQGKIHIERFPARYLSLATEIPKGFTPVGDVMLDIDLSGSPQNPLVTGSVSEPLTRKAFRF